MMMDPLNAADLLEENLLGETAWGIFAVSVANRISIDLRMRCCPE